MHRRRAFTSCRILPNPVERIIMESDQETAGPILLRDAHDGVVTLRLNRPQQFNALSEAMLASLHDAFDTLAADPHVRCVVLAAEGRAFCAGHDLRQMRGTPELDYYRTLFAQCSRVMLAMRALPVPVIARVHGIATAAGCQLVAACDLAIAADTARFAVSGINVGLFCSTPAVALSRNVTAKRAFDMLVTGRFVDAATAAAWGLVNEAVPEDALDAAVARKVAEIVAKSPAAVRYGKQMFYRQRELPLDEAYAYAGDVMARNMMEEDAGEGIDAFLEKRKPTWRS
ncbi:Enoyl-CoA hydratase [Burkholderia sp. AU4i]|nr:Enoyl-CoA hydratase [Burkholderia sp. AU4i]